MKKLMLCMLLFLFVTPVWAIEVEGVNIPNQVVLEGTTLSLNGAGMRTKFFFDMALD